MKIVQNEDTMTILIYKETTFNILFIYLNDQEYNVIQTINFDNIF
jgi:hypothetical protein